MKEIDMMFVKTPDEVSAMIVEQMKKRRKEGKLTQEQLSRKAGVSLGSLKRFETSGEISLRSLIKLAIALGCEDDFSSLFAKKQYSSIQEILDENI
ncbi:helix-turn-helix domain-containing protein [Hungatella hathewayi]|nr:helix-turn-helix transcriptional regulator [Hungatella hathewayi]